MKKLFGFLLLILVVLSFNGCADKQEMSITKAVESGQFEKVDNATVVVIADESLEDELTQTLLDEMRDDIQSELHDRGIRKGDDLTIKVIIYAFDSGSAVAAYFGNTQEKMTEFSAAVEYYDTDQTLLSEIEIDVTVEHAGLYTVVRKDKEDVFINELMKYSKKHFLNIK